MHGEDIFVILDRDDTRKRLNDFGNIINSPQLSYIHIGHWGIDANDPQVMSPKWTDGDTFVYVGYVNFNYRFLENT